MDTKFTEGEWNVKATKEYNPDAVKFQLLDAKSEPICSTLGDAVKNAHLIAMAPEMYKELNDLIPLLKYLDPLTHPNIELDCVVSGIEDLLAKARGE